MVDVRFVPTADIRRHPHVPSWKTNGFADRVPQLRKKPMSGSGWT
jgi:hypothetical protein